MSDPMISDDTPNVTSSQASACGRSPCATPAGPTPDRSGPEVAPANLSARQAEAMGLMTSGTYGLISSTLSASVALQRSLANRLRARADLVGSTLYKLTWKERTTPSGRLISALRASGRRTSGSGSTSAPTIYDLPQAPWPTPATRDWKDTGDLSGSRFRKDGKERNDTVPRVADLSGWPTCTAMDANRGEKYDPFAKNQTLNMATQLSTWPTPTAALATKGVRSTEGGIREAMRTPGPDLAAVCLTGPARLTTSGELRTGCSAAMTSGGQLNPAHSRWLMGLPSSWDQAAPLKESRGKASSGATATRSSNPSPEPSSRPVSTSTRTPTASSPYGF